MSADRLATLKRIAVECDVNADEIAAIEWAVGRVEENERLRNEGRDLWREMFCVRCLIGEPFSRKVADRACRNASTFADWPAAEPRPAGKEPSDA